MNHARGAADHGVVAVEEDAVGARIKARGDQRAGDCAGNPQRRDRALSKEVVTASQVTVGSATGTPPWATDGGMNLCPVDGGATDAGPNDAGAVQDAVADGTVHDGGMTTGDSGGGCNCEAVGGAAGSSGAALVALGGLMIGVARRRRGSLSRGA